MLLLGPSLPPVPDKVQAERAVDFLNSLGANSSISQRGEALDQTIKCVRYLGLRWLRSGIEGNIPMADFLELHTQTGVRFSWCPGSGGSDLPKLLETGRHLSKASALLAFEGPNEPNNWTITYKGEKGGGQLSWAPVANFQRDMYAAVKSDPILKNTPVWGISEDGAETDNVGLQFLETPNGSSYSDYANVHNYIYHPNSPNPEDNKTWNAADPTQACRVDGLYGEYGVTWAHHYPGYSGSQLVNLPRVTTETGTTIGGAITEEMHGKNLLTMYLDQFKRGWSFTAVYLLRDRSDEAGNQQFGFYKPDYTPRKAALYLHNLTTILADTGSLISPGSLRYAIPSEPPTVHDLLLQRSDRSFALVVWGERLSGTDKVTVNLGQPVKRVQVFDPTAGTDAVETQNGVPSVSLILSDHPVVVTFGSR